MSTHVHHGHSQPEHFTIKDKKTINSAGIVCDTGIISLDMMVHVKFALCHRSNRFPEWILDLYIKIEGMSTRASHSHGR